MDENNNNKLPSQRLAKIKQGELSLLEQITTQGNDIQKLLIAVKQINTKLAALQMSAEEQQKQHRDNHNKMKLSRKENQPIRDENKQLREELKDLKTQLLEAVSQNTATPPLASTRSARISTPALTKQLRSLKPGSTKLPRSPKPGSTRPLAASTPALTVS